MEPAGSSRQFHPLDEEHIESPIPEVKSTVSIEDDPDMAILTIRLIVIGSIVCVLQAYFQSMALIKDKAFDLNMVMVEFGILTMGRFMEEYMPDKDVPIPWTTHKVRLNPGPFNHKEHVLITVAAHMGRMRPHVLQTVVLAKGYFGKEVYLSATIMTTLILTLITFLLAGLFNNWVTSPEMWWPAKLVDVAFFRTWHDKQNVGPSGIISNKRFFYVFFGLSFAYQILPGYVFPSMTCVSVLCWFWNNSIRAQQIGSGRNGLGLFSLSLDWPSISEFSCDPLSTPPWVIYNVLGGIIFAFFIMTPAIYWTNAFDTKKFPIFTTEIFDSSGYKYNMSKVLNADRLTFNITAYDEYSVAHLSAFRIGSYGLLFGAISSSVVHVILNYGSAIWKQINHDVHNQRMRSYKPVPTPWFYIILALVISLGIGTCVTDFGPEIQFPTVGIILIACVVSLVLLPPLGILAATANLLMPVNLVFVLLGGFLYPGQQFKYMIFTNAGYQIAVNTVVLLGFQKLGHYMKLPPKGMFLVQLVASLLRDLVSIGVVWCHADTLKSNCNIDNLPVGSPWSCPSLDTYYTTASLWGILGSHRIIGDGRYKGFILSVVFVSTVAEILVSLFSKKWNFLKDIKLPIVLAATSMVPPAIPANINSWLFVGVSFPLIICKLFNYWSPTRQYLLSLSFTTGAALTGLVGVLAHAILIFFQFHVPESWGSQQEDPCRLARCPTTPGTVVDGCPVI